MYGNTIGTLEVSAVINGEGRQLVFTKSGNQGNRWIRANMTVYGLDYRVGTKNHVNFISSSKIKLFKSNIVDSRFYTIEFEFHNLQFLSLDS